MNPSENKLMVAHKNIMKFNSRSKQ